MILGFICGCMSGLIIGAVAMLVYLESNIIGGLNDDNC